MSKLRLNILVVVCVTCCCLVACVANEQEPLGNQRAAVTQPEAPKSGAEMALAKLEQQPSLRSNSSGKTSTSSEPISCLSPSEREARLRPKQSDFAERALGELLSKGTAIIAAPIAAVATTAERLGTVANSQSIAPICGNWCGTHRYIKGDNPNAVDEVDEACKRHDQCYQQFGRFHCHCDQQLLHELLAGRQSAQLGAKEQIVFLYYQGSPCGGGCKRINDIQICGAGSFGR